MALKEALCSVYWYKSELRDFLQLCLSNPGILNNFNWKNHKRQIASEVVDCLVANPYTHFGGITKICYELCKLTDFSHLNPIDDSPQIIDKARNAVNQLKQLIEPHQDIKNEEVEMADWREQCRQASLRRQKDLHDRKENETRHLAELSETRHLAELEAQQIKAAAKAESEGFYQSYEWRSLRYDALEKYGRICRICGRTPESHDVVLHVDHIKPRSKNPSLRLNIENLQILCEDCNLGKGVKDDI